MYSSVHDNEAGFLPPNASPAACVPDPAKQPLAVIKAPSEDHDVPSYFSVHDNEVDGEHPPKASASFCVPTPAKLRLAVIKAPPAVHDVPSYSSVHDDK